MDESLGVSRSEVVQGYCTVHYVGTFRLRFPPFLSFLLVLLTFYFELLVPQRLRTGFYTRAVSYPGGAKRGT